MHSLLSICLNENTSFTKVFLLNSLNARTDHDVRLGVDDVKLNTKQRHLNGILYKMWFCCKIKKNRQIGSNLISTCSFRPN